MAGNNSINNNNNFTLGDYGVNPDFNLFQPIDDLMSPSAYDPYSFDNNFGGGAMDFLGGGSGAPPVDGYDWRGLLLGGKDKKGLAPLGLDFVSGLGQYTVMRNMLQEKSKERKANVAFAQRNQMQSAKDINRRLYDRQEARQSYSRDPDLVGYSTESTADYMNRNRLGESPVRV